MQVDWQQYGVDWEGPVPVDCDSTVVVLEDANLLSDSQKEDLCELLSQVSSNPYCREEMLSQFAIARAYIIANVGLH